MRTSLTCNFGPMEKCPPLGIEFDAKQDLLTNIVITRFGLFAEVERDLISERTP